MSGIDRNVFRQNPAPYEKKGTAPVSSGAVLLCSMAALCLVVLNLVALSTADGAKRLSDACVWNIENYYEACLEANKDIADARNDGFVGMYQNTYRITEAQSLRVAVAIFSDGTYEVMIWQQVRDGEWIPDLGLDVIK